MVGIHGLYFLLPIVTFSVWICAIVGLLVLWAIRDNFNKYLNSNANIVFISDVGAVHRTFFIILCALTAFFYISTTLVERHLRHQRRITGSVRRRQTWYDIASVVCAVIGSLALVFLSVFDAFDHSNVHWSMTLIFVVFVALSVLFQVLQVFSLANDYEDLRSLKYMAIVKAIILAIAIIGAVSFIILYGVCKGDAYPGDGKCDKVISAAAVCEWAIAFMLSIFFLTYIVDLWPSHRRAKHGLSEDGTMVENRALAEEKGVAQGKLTAPNAIDGVVNNDTHYPSEAAKEYHSNGHYHADHGLPAPVTAGQNIDSSPRQGANSTLQSERGSLYQTPMIEARQTPTY